MPRLLLLSTQLLQTGGLENHLRAFCTNIVEAGVDVDLVVTNSEMLSETEDFFRSLCRHVYLDKYDRSFKGFF